MGLFFQNPSRIVRIEYFSNTSLQAIEILHFSDGCFQQHHAYTCFKRRLNQKQKLDKLDPSPRLGQVGLVWLGLAKLGRPI